MNWKWLFVILFFFGSFLTVFKLLSYNPNLALKQGMNQYSTNPSTISATTNECTVLTTKVPKLPWKHSLEIDVEKYQTDYKVRDGIVKSNKDPFFHPGAHILRAHERLKTMIMPEYSYTHFSIIGKVDKQIIDDATNYFHLLEEIMDSAWECRSACLNATEMQCYMDTDFQKFFELFRPDNVKLYEKIQQRTAYLNDEIDLIDLIDRFVKNLLALLNVCIVKYNSMHKEHLQEFQYANDSVKSILRAGNSIYHPKANGKSRFR